jgi:hypothetical protein
MSGFYGWKRAAWAAVAVGLLASPVVAKLYCAKTTAYVVGSDSYGCPSWENGASGSAKTVKDSCTGIIVRIGTACVRNESGCSQCYSDLGYCIEDPWCQTTYTATSDTTILSKPIKCKSKACATAVYNPCYASGDEYYGTPE